MSQCARLKNWLEQHGSIEPLEALNALGIYRLAARIGDLKREGLQISTSMVKVSNRFGEECRVARYVLIRGVV